MEKEGFKEMHIIKDGKEIQKYNVRSYPDGREINVEDNFTVVNPAEEDGNVSQEVSEAKGLG